LVIKKVFIPFVQGEKMSILLEKILWKTLRKPKSFITEIFWPKYP